MPLSGESSMKKLGSEKRKQLVMVVALTGMALIGLRFGLIRSQMQTLERLSKQKEDAQKKYDQVTQVIKSEAQVEAQLSQISQSLSEIETGMATGDLYSWVINT